MEQETPDTTPEAQIQELRDQQTNTMLSVLATLSNIPGITLDEVEWPYLLDYENAPQRYRATVAFWVP